VQPSDHILAYCVWQQVESALGEEEDLMTAADAARELGVSRQRMTELANLGRLGRRVAGRYWVFTHKEIEDYKRQRKVGRPPSDKPRTIDIERPADPGPASLDDGPPTNRSDVQPDNDPRTG